VNAALEEALNAYIVDGCLPLDIQTNLIAQGYDLDSVEAWCSRNNMTIEEN
jgi:hypothetical protein